MNGTTVKDRIKSLCTEKGIALSALDRTLGFGNGTVGGWDKCSPSAEKLLRVAMFFGVSVDSLLGYSSSPAPSISPEARAVALAYDSADEDTRFVVRHSLGLTQKKPASLPG